MSKREDLFTTVPVSKAVLTLAVPTVLSQLITVIYNIADTFFLGKLNDPVQVAAVTLAMPIYMMINAIANLFGIGGTSAISRCLGRGNRDRAMKCASFCIWAGAGVGFCYGILVFIAKPLLFPILGSTNETYEYLNQYVFWTIALGSLPSVMNPLMAHLIRSEGYSRQAGFGVAFGGILNIILDPFFIFVLGMELKGAAIATLISNFIAWCYYLIFIFKLRGHSVISLSPRYFSAGDKILSEIITVGFPSAVISIMGTISNTALNNIISSYSTQAIAGMGIAKKINLAAFTLSQGSSQGALPLIGYNYSSGNRKRLMASIKMLCIYTIGASLLIVLILHFASEPIVRSFINDAATVEYGSTFLKIICLACPFTAMSFIIISVFQASGRKIQPTILSFLRKGVLDIPLMIICNSLWGLKSVAIATPVADGLAMLIGLAMFIPFLRHIKQA